MLGGGCERAGVVAGFGVCLGFGFAGAVVGGAVVGACVVGAAGAVLLPPPPPLVVLVPPLFLCEDEVVDLVVALALGACSGEGDGDTGDVVAAPGVVAATADALWLLPAAAAWPGPPLSTSAVASTMIRIAAAVAIIAGRRASWSQRARGGGCSLGGS
jgi:hypothetical protein